MATDTFLSPYVDAVIAAISAADWATALEKVLQVETALVGHPDTKIGGVESSEIIWSRGDVRELRKYIEKRHNASAGIRRTKISYVRPTD